MIIVLVVLKWANVQSKIPYPYTQIGRFMVLFLHKMYRTTIKLLWKLHHRMNIKTSKNLYKKCAQSCVEFVTHTHTQQNLGENSNLCIGNTFASICENQFEMFAVVSFNKRVRLYDRATLNFFCISATQPWSHGKNNAKIFITFKCSIWE